MRSAFGIALMTASACAAEFSLMETAANNAWTAFTQTETYQNWPTTRGDVKANIAANPLQYGQRKVAPLSVHHRTRAEQAHHNVMATRSRLGMAAVGTGPVVGQDYAQLNSTAGMILNIAQGLAYNPQNNQCYYALESFIIASDTSSDIFKKLYIPAFWAEGQVQTQDLMAISSMLYVDCKMSKAFTTISHIFSSEGVSELGGRVMGAYPFEISDCIEKWNNSDAYDTSKRGYSYGKCLSVILNYSI